MAIVTRLGKGSKLTAKEMDNNLLSLESDISGSVSAITSKLDKGAYTGTAKDLDNAIIAAVTGASGISIVPTSPAPAGTGVASFTATQAGTYTNYGGVVVAANSFAIISRSAAGVFSISQTALDLSTYAKIVDFNNLKNDTLGGSDSISIVPTIVQDNQAYTDQGSLTSSTGAKRTDAIDISTYSSVIVTLTSYGATSTRATVFKDINGSLVYAIFERDYPLVDGVRKITVNVTNHKNLFVSVSGGASFTITGINVTIGIKQDLADVKLRSLGLETPTPITTTLIQDGQAYNSSGNLAATANSSRTNAIDVTGFTNVVLTLVNFGSTSTRATVFKDLNGVLISSFFERDFPLVNGVRKITVTITNHKNIFISTNIGTTFSLVGVVLTKGTSQKVDDIEAITRKTIYISPAGLDTNSGVIGSPMLTLNAAMTAKASTILCLPGVYEQKLDLNNLAGSDLTIRSSLLGNVIFKESTNSIISNGSETLVSGYTKVFSFPLAANPYPASESSAWFFQENISDETTLISDTDRMPLQRGKVYRLENTVIRKTTATVLSSALAEIEAAEGFKYFYDTVGLVFYFRRAATTNGNPIKYSKGNNFILNANRGDSLNMVGIDVHFMAINLNNLTSPRVSNCSAKYVRAGGAFMYDEAIDVQFDRCEAAACFSGANGDGFNAHSGLVANPFARHTNAILQECWSHDNNDDGFSDHERCESTMIGGLFENNGKAGVTPAYGSHFVGHNILSRFNFAGFYYVGDTAVSEGGKFGQMTLQGCVSNGNTFGGSNAGFVSDSSNNNIRLISCRAFNETTGFKSSGTSKMILIDCGAKNCVTVRTGSNIVIDNTTLVV
jgi:hypothetical protein